MTTTQEDDPTEQLLYVKPSLASGVLMKVVVVAEQHFCTEVITAEHHPDEEGMPFILQIVGGKHHGLVIHCSTEESVCELFKQIVAARRGNYEHPYLAAV